MNQDDIVAMIGHWLSTPKNAYWGQNYGQDLKKELLKNTTEFHADRLIAQMKNDIPLLANLSHDELGVLMQHEGFEKVKVFVQVFNVLIELTS